MGIFKVWNKKIFDPLFCIWSLKGNQEMNTLQKKMQTFKENLAKKKTISLKYKRDLNYIYDQKLESINIRRKCNWYEDGERSSKFF